ncbi:MAG: hypothetical protein ABI856_17880 [Nitrospira sp.]
MLTTHVRIQTITLIVIGLALGTGFSVWPPGAAQSATTAGSERMLLPDDRIVPGTVQTVKSGQIQVNIGELMPVVLSVEAAREKGMPSLKPGDKLVLVVTDQNEFIDFHLADQPGWDRVVKGHLAQPVVGDQRWAVIRTAQGKLEPYEVAQGNDARQKVLNIPIGVPALFLLDKANLVIDATFGNERALLEALAEWSTDRQRIIHR